jgi:hypothetical protein
VQQAAECGSLHRAAGPEEKLPTANSTVITYAAGDRTVYMTNEPPIPGFYSEASDELFVWIPGVEEPSDEDRAVVARVIAAHEADSPFLGGGYEAHPSSTTPAGMLRT